ncbi:hypothetical protein CMV30_19055 [Nibricoccus aquaticus]|uniref:Glycosyltransferase subfamily 4-like N-terminal domain-containing protein n=1 Tax=Nibricoccus aquaticus TaxID=2576891 RepID=A0A290QC99_9BACT|nr:glycosyltransferase [Nibricoccus aquaticus]ATC65877.1 hypothetical protein CMV30_19055 [Nibricoccus aquaticus]
MTSKLAGRRIACFFPWKPFEPTGAWCRFQCLWRFLLDQGCEVTLCLLADGADAQLKNVAVSFPKNFNLVGAVWNFGQKLATGAHRRELKGLTQAEIGLLLMYEKTLYTENAEFSQWLHERVSDHDLMICEYPMMLPVLADCCRKAGKPLIATSYDALFELHGTTPFGRDTLRRKEIEALSLADEVVFCTETERKLFESFKIRGHVVPNTGDARSVTPGKHEEFKASVTASLALKTPHFVLFVGSDHGPNREAVAEIKQFARQIPEVSFVIAGTCCPKSTEGNVIALGSVEPGILDSLYRGASTVIVPLLRGTGMSLKTFEAFNYAKALISTPVGARGFTVESGKELLLVEKPTDFPAAIRQLLSDATLRERLGLNARAYAEKLDYRNQFSPYADIIERLLATSPAPAITKTAPPGLLLVDNNLSDHIGHHYNYALSLRDHCRAAGFGFSALVKQKAAADILSELDGVPLFRQGLHEDAAQNPYPAEWGHMRGMYDFLASNDRFARELEEGLQSRARSGEVIFLPNATPRQILGVALLLNKNPIYRLLRFVLMLRYSVNSGVGPINARKAFFDKETAEHYLFSFDKLAGVSADCVRLVTDSQELAKEYATLARRPVEVMPIPHTANEDAGAAVAGVPTKNKSKLRVVFLGDARDEKGFELLPALARACAQEPWLSKVELVFHAYISSHYHLKMGTVIEELSGVKARNLSLVKSSLSAAAYRHLLATADLVLLPYDSITYRSRTSGPFVEAICAGKPVVAPAQSWMSIQLGTSGAGKTFSSGNVGDFVAAVLAVLQNHATYATAAQELGCKYREYHNPENFVRQLVGAGS